MLVQVTNVDQLIDRLVKGKYKSKSDILAKSLFPLSFLTSNPYLNTSTVKQAVSDDDDIVAGPQKMSLKCPVRLPLCHSKLTTPHILVIS